MVLRKGLIAIPELDWRACTSPSNRGAETRVTYEYYNCRSGRPRTGQSARGSPLGTRARAARRRSRSKLAGRIGGNTAVTSPWPGVRFETDLSDRIQRQMWAGVYEPHVREAFRAILEPGAVYFDVGAHIGFHAVFAAHRVGQGLGAFLPSKLPHVFMSAWRTIFLNSLGRKLARTPPFGSAADPSRSNAPPR